MKDEKQHNPDPLFSAIKDGLAAITEASDFITQRGQNTIEFYLESKSTELDKHIIDLEKSGLGKFVAGEVHIILDGSDDFHLEGEFYFKNNQEAWVKKAVKGKSIKLDWAFVPDEQEKLRTSKKITLA